jgi:hypothetical protein
MRRIFLVLVFLVNGVRGAVEPPLPTWDEKVRSEMIKEGWLAGGILLDFDSLPEEEKEPETVLEGVDTRVEDLGVEVDSSEVQEKYLLEYFADKSKSFLVDPQGLIPDRERHDLEAFLDYHSVDSSIAMYVYLFGADQEIPSDVREEEIVERLYSVGKPAVVIYYYVGAPQRTTMYISPVITDVVSASEQRRAVESAVTKAFAHTDGIDQLESFLVQMSIRIYWMERMTLGMASETMESMPGKGDRKILTRKKDADFSFKREVMPWFGVSVGAVVSFVGLLMLVWGIVMWFKLRRRYEFPEFEVEPRMGASHAAGIGAVISFSNSSISPASQRDQLPGYVRRA